MKWIEPKLKVHPFGDFPGILDVRINSAGDRRTAKIAAAEEGYFTRVLVSLLGYQRTQRDARLDVHACAEHQACHFAVWQYVGCVDVQHVCAVRVQEADALLILKKTQLPFRQVKQRADAGGGLAVVLAERAFIVSSQLRQAVVGGERPIGAKGLAHFELQRLVLTFRILVSIRLAIPVALAAEPRAPASLALGKVGAVRQEDKFWICRAGGPRRIKTVGGHSPPLLVSPLDESAARCPSCPFALVNSRLVESNAVLSENDSLHS